LPLEVAKQHIDWAQRNGVKVIQLTGGEPLVYPHLPELLHYIYRHGMYSFLATSGYNHSRKAYDLLKTSGLTAICVSVNDIKKEQNDKTRDAFSQSIASIADACASQLMCLGNVVLSDENIERLAELGEYLKAQGVYGVNILKPVPSFDGKYIPCVSKNTIERLHQVVCEGRDFYRVESCFREYWEFVKDEPFRCAGIGKTTYFVNVDGMVSPCSKTTGHRYRSFVEMLTQRGDWGCGCK